MACGDRVQVNLSWDADQDLWGTEQMSLVVAIRPSSLDVRIDEFA